MLLKLYFIEKERRESPTPERSCVLKDVRTWDAISQRTVPKKHGIKTVSGKG